MYIQLSLYVLYVHMLYIIYVCGHTANFFGWAVSCTHAVCHFSVNCMSRFTYVAASEQWVLQGGGLSPQSRPIGIYTIVLPSCLSPQCTTGVYTMSVLPHTLLCLQGAGTLGLHCPLNCPSEATGVQIRYPSLPLWEVSISLWLYATRWNCVWVWCSDDRMGMYCVQI